MYDTWIMVEKKQVNKWLYMDGNLGTKTNQSYKPIKWNETIIWIFKQECNKDGYFHITKERFTIITWQWFSNEYQWCGLFTLSDNSWIFSCQDSMLVSKTHSRFYLMAWSWLISIEIHPMPRNNTYVEPEENLPSPWATFSLSHVHPSVHNLQFPTFSFWCHPLEFVPSCLESRQYIYNYIACQVYMLNAFK